MLQAAQFSDAFRGKRVLVTGHTGFKGSWLCEWLLALGAEVAGLALEPPTTPSLFEQLGLAARMADHRVDVRDLESVCALVDAFRPDFVFHLAAQPLVRLSYTEPVSTFATNVMGTIHVMEALRRAKRPCIAVLITTDKCYENREWLYGYREEDPMGGHDPYSASKGAAEIAISSYRRSFFAGDSRHVLIASARAGNVIGGGDWASDRIVPDCMRSLAAGAPIVVRNPSSTRPWQHVLEPLGGYLVLAAEIDAARAAGDEQRLDALCSGFNFGPVLDSNRKVGELVGEILRHWPGSWTDGSAPGQLHEAGKLNLSIDKAWHMLGWSPYWSFAECVARTVVWYRSAHENPDSALELTRAQLSAYQACMFGKQP